MIDWYLFEIYDWQKNGLTGGLWGRRLLIVVVDGDVVVVADEDVVVVLKNSKFSMIQHNNHVWFSVCNYTSNDVDIDSGFSRFATHHFRWVLEQAFCERFKASLKYRIIISFYISRLLQVSPHSIFCSASNHIDLRHLCTTLIERKTKEKAFSQNESTCWCCSTQTRKLKSNKKVFRNTSVGEETRTRILISIRIATLGCLEMNFKLSMLNSMRFYKVISIPNKHIKW